MAKFKIQAGAEIDTVTRDEMKEVLRHGLRDWMVEIIKGARPVRFSGWGNVSSGAVTIGGATGNATATGAMGPAQGMVWSVKRLYVGGLGTGDVLNVYVNNASPFDQVTAGVGSTQPPTVTLPYVKFGSNELILSSGDQLLLTGSGLTATGQITVAGQAWELPEGMMWRLS